jgi:hypothetical protein
MHLFELNQFNDAPVYVVARDHHEAVTLFSTWSGSNNRKVSSSVTADGVPLEDTDFELRDIVQRAFNAGLVGVVLFDDEEGWSISLPMWQPLYPDEFSDEIGDAR